MSVENKVVERTFDSSIPWAVAAAIPFPLNVVTIAGEVFGSVAYSYSHKNSLALTAGMGAYIFHGVYNFLNRVEEFPLEEQLGVAFAGGMVAGTVVAITKKYSSDAVPRELTETTAKTLAVFYGACSMLSTIYTGFTQGCARFLGVGTVLAVGVDMGDALASWYLDN